MMFLTGAESKEDLRAIEALSTPEQLDRFGRSREVLRKYANNARKCTSLTGFMSWYKSFIRYSGEIRNPTVTGNAGDDRVLLAGFGIAGEGGEVNDILKKVYFHDHANKDTMSPDRRAKLLLELGDRFWYDFNLMDELGIDFRDVIQANMDKLTEDPRTN
jgi:NTP pyrophosphatase (non-canonical NTP hydrolase)